MLVGNLVQSAPKEESRMFLDIWDKIQYCRGYETLADLAQESIKRELDSRGVKYAVKISGPITNGGFIGVERTHGINLNLSRFGEGIACLRELGLVVFDERPFEKRLWFIEGVIQKNRLPELKKFRSRVIDPGFIKALFLLPGWQRSTGAKWEKNLAQERRIPVIFPRQWCPSPWIAEMEHHHK